MQVRCARGRGARRCRQDHRGVRGVGLHGAREDRFHEGRDALARRRPVVAGRAAGTLPLQDALLHAVQLLGVEGRIWKVRRLSGGRRPRICRSARPLKKGWGGSAPHKSEGAALQTAGADTTGRVPPGVASPAILQFGDSPEISFPLFSPMGWGIIFPSCPQKGEAYRFPAQR